jgi:hypothetical protein
MSMACSKDGREEVCIQGFDGKPEDDRLLGRSKRRCEDNIEMDLRDF